MAIYEQQDFETECFEGDELEIVSINEAAIEVNQSTTENLNGISGWLIPIAIGRVLSPIVFILAILNSYLLNFTNKEFAKLYQPGNAAYSEFWKPTITFELCSNVVLLILGIALLFFFFGKKKWFPRIYIAFMILTIVFAITDAILMYKIQSSISIKLNINTTAQVFRSIIGGVIWIPYFLNSVRVKNTFVR